MSTTMPLLARWCTAFPPCPCTRRHWQRRCGRLAWMDFPPLVTIAAIGRFSLRYILYCASRAIVSDSTRANLYAATLELFTPSPLTGLNLIHAPASVL